MQDDVVIEALKVQNRTTRRYDQQQISKLDEQWRAEVATGSFNLVRDVIDNRLSRYLRRAKLESEGIFDEIFVVDAVGLLAGTSDPNTDYWQGDEHKYLKTFGRGKAAVYASDVHFDETFMPWRSIGDQRVGPSYLTLLLTTRHQGPFLRPLTALTWTRFPPSPPSLKPSITLREVPLPSHAPLAESSCCSQGHTIAPTAWHST